MGGAVVAKRMCGVNHYRRLPVVRKVTGQYHERRTWRLICTQQVLSLTDWLCGVRDHPGVHLSSVHTDAICSQAAFVFTRGSMISASAHTLRAQVDHRTREPSESKESRE
jgi:hypothetical protein